ncbi:unnamed protein product [Sphagnum balticum]
MVGTGTPLLDRSIDFVRLLELGLTELFTGGEHLMNSAELDLVLNTLGYELTLLELAYFITEVDLNASGSIDFDELVILILLKLQSTAK